MAIYTYPHVEDYIEIISGYRKPDGKSSSSIFLTLDPLISLARYDVKFIESLAEQTIACNTGYTDKQAKLAADIVLKYERQLAKHNIDVTPVRTPVFRNKLREIDRVSILWIEKDQLKLKFPYNNTVIDQVREQSKLSNGMIRFNREEKVWMVALTEPNLSWAHTWASVHGFIIDPAVTDLMNRIIEIEKTPYNIELTVVDGQLTITNATDSLNDYINANLGGFSDSNLLTLIDYAPILGYTISDIIRDTVSEAYGKNFLTLASSRELKINPVTGLSTNRLAEVVEYAKKTNRFPIYVYEPDLSHKLLEEFKRWFSNERITYLGKNKPGITESTMIVYTTKIPKDQTESIPLLISSAGMMFGGDKELWIQQAEKVVFFSDNVYNKQNRGRDVCKLD